MENQWFLGQFPDGAILDEVHRVPDLLSYLQGILDAKKVNGQYILTGSCNFRLMQIITQSLAGRVGIVELMPFAYNELLKADAAPLQVEDLLFKGLFPAVYDQKLNASQWYNSYIMTYLERDVRQLINLKDLSAFHHFLVLCASN